METPDNLRYSKSHEWVRLEGKFAFVGVTDHAQEQLGDIVYVELPKVGEQVSQDSAYGVLESVKAVSDCYSPVSGTVVEVNDSLNDAPQTVNDDCYGEGWMMKVELSDASEIENLMDPAAYQAFVAEESH